MRVVQLNLAADFSIATPGELLDRYHTLTHWSSAVAAAGATVAVVQRFTSTQRRERDGITYIMIDDHEPAMLRPWVVSQPVVDAVMQFSPDVVHVNGLMFPGMSRALRATLGQHCVIVLQDHSGAVPVSRATRWLTTRQWRRAFQCADACTFTAVDLAARWFEVGLPRTFNVLELAEASTTFVPLPSSEARSQTGMAGSPIILWVGRLDENKDPMTVLSGVEAAMQTLPHARLWMVAPHGDWRARVQQRIQSSQVLRQAVSIVGPVPYQQMPFYYSSADVLVSGSHHEGSGYALLEAMACGVTPCVTDIPAFRALAGSTGALWRTGDPAACAAAIAAAAQRVSPDERVRVRNDFERRLSWRVLGQHTVDAYSALLSSRRTRT